jgi:hypothetical protein
VRFIQDESQVFTVTTRGGWVYKVVKGTFGLDRDENGSEFAVFQAYGRGGASRRWVTIRISEIASVVEDVAV